MNVQRLIRIIAGSFILLSLTLAHNFNDINLLQLSWLWFTAFIGVNLLQSGFTRWCLMEDILKKLGICSEPNSSCNKC
ncbi:MAG: DUF2892 domain-containing protein [Mariprofundales bacterium]